LPAWYVITVVLAAGALFVAFKVVEVML